MSLVTCVCDPRIHLFQPSCIEEDSAPSALSPEPQRELRLLGGFPSGALGSLRISQEKKEKNKSGMAALCSAIRLDVRVLEVE